jgi:hypothetical protein
MPHPCLAKKTPESVGAQSPGRMGQAGHLFAERTRLLQFRTGRPLPVGAQITWANGQAGRLFAERTRLLQFRTGLPLPVGAQSPGRMGQAGRLFAERTRLLQFRTGGCPSRSPVPWANRGLYTFWNQLSKTSVQEVIEP